jgi:acyl carrier protein
VTLRDRLAALQEERYRLVLATVCAEVSKIFGRRDHDWASLDRAFSELGFDSQMTVALRNRLSEASGLRLPDTVMWDYGSASGLAHYIEAELAGQCNRNHLPAAATADAEAVTVAGMGCRYPGGSPELGFATTHTKPVLDRLRPSASGELGEQVEVTISDASTQTLPAEGEVGVVEIGSLTLESGAVIDDVSIAVQRWGELSPARDNVVVVLHALSGD